MSAAGTTIAGLPQYVVLKKTDNYYLQYLWNDEFGEFYKCMGTNRVLDPVSPFVKLEVVPSTTDPSFIHLRCSYNGKFVQLVTIDGLYAAAATADAAVEDRDEESCTLFQPVWTDPTRMYLISMRNTNGGVLYTFENTSYEAKFNGVFIATSTNEVTSFLPSRWVSFEEEKVAAEKEAQALKGQVSALEAAAGEREAELAAAESNVEAQVAAVWKAFKANTTTA